MMLNMKKIGWLICSLFLSAWIPAQAQKSQHIKRVEPLHWWTDMKQPDLQLIVYGEGLGDAEASIDQEKSGVELVAVHPVENKNYVFLDLRIGPEAKAGTFNISFKKGGKAWATYPYELKARNKERVKAQGLTTADFIYLLMPDRFANGNPENDRVAGLLESTLNRDSMYHRHGGDLEGVINRLDYLEMLGVTALWMTPVVTNDMEQASYHGYANTENYHIDPRFGSNADYARLADSLHGRGMKLVHDVVPNHVGLNHWTVRDMPFPNWVHQWPSYTNTTYKDQAIYDPYAAENDRKKMQNGWFVPTMPDLNQEEPFVRNYITQSHIWWIEEAGVDAFRIDTYPYNNLGFMAEWSDRIQEEYPSFSLFGETWVHGVANQVFFTQGKTLNQQVDTRLPGVTDFQLNYAIIEAMSGNEDWTGGANKLYTTLATDFLYEDPKRNVVFLGNHDMSRIFSVLGEHPEKMKSAAAWLLTTRGIPQWYYGDELLMKNFSDPDGKVREDMKGGWKGDPINKFDSAGRGPEEDEFYRYVRTLAQYRKKEPVLQTGRLLQYVPESGVYVYFRIGEDKRVMVVMNTLERKQQVDLSRFEEGLGKASEGKVVSSGERTKLNLLDLEPFQTLVIELDT